MLVNAMTVTENVLPACRDCGQSVSPDALACPHCGAPYPANPAWNGSGFEYKSAATLFGLPLVHIAFGRDRRRKLRIATGIIAIGQFGRGGITIAQFGFGIIFIGQCGAGLLAAGQIVLAGLALAQIPIALAAIGQIPITLLWAKGQIPIVYLKG
jgi:hypothetical protein